jgi:hypothetical protein
MPEVHSIRFDTLKFVNRLKAVGIPEAQAEAFVDAFKEAQGEAELATKADIAALKQDMKALEERLTAKLYQALLVQTLTLTVLFGALKFFT